MGNRPKDSGTLAPDAEVAQRRRHSRLRDVKRLLNARTKRVDKTKDDTDSVFNWEHRYDAKYICKYARDSEWSQSRLNAAIRSIDLEERQMKAKELASKEPR